MNIRLYVVGGLIAIAMLLFHRAYMEKLELQSPIIETCIKHPANRKIIVQ